MKKTLLVAIIALLACFMLVSCGMFGSDDPPDDSGNKPGGDVPWDESNPDASTAFASLLESVYNSLNDVSTNTIPSKKTALTLDTEFGLSLNENAFTVAVKGKYQYKGATELPTVMLSAEIINVDTNAVILGAYYGKPTGVSEETLYIQINDGKSGKLKFNINNKSAVNNFFPIKNFKQDSIVTLSTALGTIIDIKGQITAKNRTYGTIPESQYSMDINLSTTLKKLAQIFLGQNTQVDLDKLFESEEDQAAFEKIIESVFGMSLDKIVSGNLPASTLSLSYASSNKLLTSLNLGVSIPANTGMAGSLFGGKKVDLELSMNKLDITNNYNSDVGMKFFTQNTYQQYKDFINVDGTSSPSSYGITLELMSTEISSDTAEEYDVRLEFSLFDGVGAGVKQEILLEVSIAGETEPYWGIYFKDGDVYIYLIDEDSFKYSAQRVYRGKDAMTIIDGLKDQIGTAVNTKMGMMQIVASVLSAMQIGKDSLILNADEALINTFVLDMDDLIDVLATALEIDLVSELASLGVDIPGYVSDHKFKITIAFDDEFIYELKDEIEFPVFPE